MAVTQQALGFWRGFSALLGGARSLLGQPRAWSYALVPALVFVLLEGSIIYLAFEYLKPSVSQRLTGDSWWQPAAAWLASWVTTLVTAGLGWVVSAALAPPLSSPALERIVGIVEQDVRAPERAPLGFLAEFSCGLRSMLLGSAVTLPIVIGLTVLELIFAPVAVVATPLKLIIGALGVAWGLFDYPLTLRGVSGRERLAFMKRHASLVLGFGTAFALLFWLPCCGTLMLPVGVVAATRLLWEIERTTPSGLLGARAGELPSASSS